jgi:very-short-patch-repair endonuclease
MSLLQPKPCSWQRLRARQLGGHRYYRQHLIDRFIVDFVCVKAALVVEVDGDIHLHQVEADQEREECLHDLGYRIIRFTNDQVCDRTNQVLQQVLAALEDTPVPKLA